jgi:hypothetical protein
MPMPLGGQCAAGGKPQVEVFMMEAEEPPVQKHSNHLLGEEAHVWP